MTMNTDDESTSSLRASTPLAGSAITVRKEMKDLPELPSSESEDGNVDEKKKEGLEEADNPTPKATNNQLPAIHVGTLVEGGDGQANEENTEGSEVGADMGTNSGMQMSVEHNDDRNKDQTHLSESTTSSSNTGSITESSYLRTLTPSTLSLSSTLSSVAESEEYLQKLQSSFTRTEQTLYSQLQQARVETLNDVRRNFHSSAKGLVKRLRAWQKKHLLRLAIGSRNGNHKRDGERHRKMLIGLLKETFDVESTATTTMGLKELVEMIPKCEEPEWWNSVCHVIPANNVIVREDDWGSLIAFTLRHVSFSFLPEPFINAYSSSPDYHRELANLTSRPPLSSPPLPVDSSLTAPTTSFFNASKFFGGSSTPENHLDPDRDDIIWQEPESYSTVVSRKDHPRDHSNSILSIREVLRHKSPALVDYPGLGGSGAASASAPSLTQYTHAPGTSDASTISSVYAKPDVKLSTQAVGGEVSGTGGRSFNLAAVASASATAAAVLAAERKMGKKESFVTFRRQESSLREVVPSGTGDTHAEEAKDMTTTTRGQSTRGSSMMTTLTMSHQAHRSGSAAISESQASTTGSSNVMDTHIRRGKTESLLSFFSSSEMNVVDDREEGKVEPAPAPPPKDKGFVDGKLVSAPSFAAMKELPETPTSSPQIHQPTPSATSISGAIANSLNMAMQYMLNHSSDPLHSSPSPSQTHPLPPTPPATFKKPLQLHNLLLVDLNQIDERPHIKYDWTIGKRLKFSCTIYYAKQFELMRKRCGIDDTFLKSLERCIHWVAEGGKSKSNFWKTMDDKFIIKTLVDAWNVADLYAILFFRPVKIAFSDE